MTITITITLIATHALAFAIGYWAKRQNWFIGSTMPWPHPPNTPRTEQSEEQ